MKRGLSRFLLLTVGIILAFSAFIKPGDSNNGSYYDSDKNMKQTRAEIQQDLVSAYSATASSKYKGTATVKTTYLSMAVVAENISQKTVLKAWNDRHEDKQIRGVCGLVSLSMLFRKYMDVNVLKTDTAYGIFAKLADYAWSVGIFDSDDNSGTTTYEEKKIANHYLDKYQKDKFTANVDEIGLWGTLKDYLDNKVKPVTLSLQGKNDKHSVLATACYVETVTYKKKNVFGGWTTKTADYKIVRVCNGWSDTNRSQWNSTTNRYIYFDCVLDLLKLK